MGQFSVGAVMNSINLEDAEQVVSTSLILLSLTSVLYLLVFRILEWGYTIPLLSRRMVVYMHGAQTISDRLLFL